MIEVRRRTIPWLRRPNPARKWPMFELWRSPEATILDTIESFRWIRDADVTEQIALETLAARIGHRHSRVLDPNFTIREIVVSRVRERAPFVFFYSGRDAGSAIRDSRQLGAK